MTIGVRSVRGRGIKRGADAPREALDLDVSKADLLEAAWELASLCNDGEGCDDAPATLAKLVETLNGARERSGRKPVRTWNRETKGWVKA